jgi:glycerophosphoryl diester phosphodiesterase
MTYLIAHRGIKNRENTIAGIIHASEVLNIIELDVRFNTNREVILCHDREDRNFSENETLIQLCQHRNPLFLMIDIKAYGISSAYEIANVVYKIVTSYPHHTYYLCSFNEFCVRKLLSLRNSNNFSIGVISSGIPINLFQHLIGLDFISLDCNIISEDIVKIFHKNNMLVFTWTVNSLDMQYYVINVCNVDGIIYDIFD